MINKSFQLIRTNPLLTSNLKVVVDSNYKLYLESFNSNSDLSNVKFKHMTMTKTEYLEDKIPKFYKGLPIDLAFDVKYDNDNKVIQSKYDHQFDTTYFSGGAYVEDQWYSEEFDYLAPLYIRKDSLPKGFVILRVDDPSGYNLNVNNYFELNSLSSSNFKEIVDNWKCIKFFDMSYSSDLGSWLTNNYTNNARFPKTAFEYHPERAEFSYWYGMDYKTGIYTSHPIFMDDRDEIETPHFRWEKYITEGYKQSGIIFPFILNLKFLFDDTPATPDTLRKYSMNRYFGFYVDSMDYVGSVTSYRSPAMIENTYLVNNIIVSGFTGMTTDQICRLDYYDIPTVNPFTGTWDDSKQYYVFVDNTSDFDRTKTISGLYQVQRVMQNNKYVYKVISDEILDPYWNTGYTNIKTVDINYTGNYNIISGITDDFFVDKYIDCNGYEKYMYGDLYLIEIGDKYHVLKYSSGMTEENELTVDPLTGDLEDWKYYIQTDYAINLDSKNLEYWILGKNSDYYKQVPVETTVAPPLTFPIYRVKFSDIKDFDFERIHTGYSDFDYEKSEYVDTTEEKLWAFDYNDPSIPPSKRVEEPGTPAQYKISNISSEYIADDELYEVFDLGQQNTFAGSNNTENKLYELTDIWRKNQSICKWGFMGSISHSDYPYKLNNNYEVGGPYNRTCDPFYTIPDPVSKNMDYFYRLGNFYDGTSGSTVYYKNQTTNIQYDFVTGQIGSGFDLDAYFTLNFDYFTYWFKNKEYYEENAQLYTRSYDKYSVFNYGDDNVPSVTLFKGLKIKLNEVQNIYTTEDGKTINKILFGTKSYNNYKLSIIFNENYAGLNTGLLNNKYIDTSRNSISVILNEKYQNVLIILNAMMSGDTIDSGTLNDTSLFNEKDGLYYGKKLDGSFITGNNSYNPNIFTASNFINAINDYNVDYGLSVKYYWIKESDEIIYTGNTTANNFGNSSMSNIPEWPYNFMPFILTIETPVPMSLNNNCYTTYPYYVNSVQDDYVATLLTFNENRNEKTLIYRFSGPYEPVFKDISLFEGGYFCYNNIQATTGVTMSGATQSNASASFEFPSTPPAQWEGFEKICSVDGGYIQINFPPTGGDTTSKFLCIRGFDFSIIPPDAIINGIEMSLTRKSFAYVPQNDPLGIYVQDSVVCLARTCYDTTLLSDNKANQGSILDNPLIPYWSTTQQTVKYGSPTDFWGDGPTPPGTPGAWSGSTLKGIDVSNPLFGIVMAVSMRNSGTTDKSMILPQIQCAQLKIYYSWNTVVYTATDTVYFDNNYKFDTNLNDFGEIDELIYSKVNENSDILKDSPDIYHIYPSIDEFGYEYGERFIFKSSWDKEFFTKTNNSLKEDSGHV